MAKRMRTRKRYSKKRYSKKRYSKKRYSKKRYSKKRYSKKRYSKKRRQSGGDIVARAKKLIKDAEKALENAEEDTEAHRYAAAELARLRVDQEDILSLDDK